MGGAGRGRAERVHPAGAIHLARAGPPVRQRSVRSRAAWSAARFQVRGPPTDRPRHSPTSHGRAAALGTSPIPGTKRVSRVEENTAADGIELNAEQIERLNNLTPATGERHDEGNMAIIDR
jgi:hypothetical protein